MDSSKLVDNCPHLNASNITYSLAGKKVFREQCMKCFEDPVSFSFIISKMREELMFV
jgi:hypothetical protein